MASRDEILEHVLRPIESILGSYTDIDEALNVFHYKFADVEPEKIRKATQKVLSDWEKRTKPTPLIIYRAIEWDKPRAESQGVMHGTRYRTYPPEGGTVLNRQITTKVWDARWDMAERVLWRDQKGEYYRSIERGHVLHHWILEMGQTPAQWESEAVEEYHDWYLRHIEELLDRGDPKSKRVANFYKCGLLKYNDKWNPDWGDPPDENLDPLSVELKKL